MVRCKMKLTHIESNDFGTFVQKTYHFQPQYDNTIHEDVRFAKASPSGQFKILIDNEAAQAQFEVGKFYYFDASPVIGCDDIPF